MTKQGYYDLLVKSAYNGTFPSYSHNICLYRADRTATSRQRCAAGLLIPDEEYGSDLEGAFYSVFRKDWVPVDMTIPDIKRIQVLHDNIARDLGGGWDAGAFVDRINALECFKDIA